jgi:hypothetical protein
VTTLRQRLAQQPPDALAAKHACARARAALARLDSGGANSIYGGADGGGGLERGGAVVGVVATPRVGVVGEGAGVADVYIEQVERVRRELEEVEAAVAGVLELCWRMLTYADVCWRMLAYADVCWRMLAYADVCWRMLAYADVWWRRRLRVWWSGI